MKILSSWLVVIADLVGVSFGTVGFFRFLVDEDEETNK